MKAWAILHKVPPEALRPSLKLELLEIGFSETVPEIRPVINQLVKIWLNHAGSYLGVCAPNFSFLFPSWNVI